MKRSTSRPSKFLIDENLSPLLAGLLKSLGYAAFSVEDAQLSGQPDTVIRAKAKANKWIIITQDLGFGFVYSQLEKSPSVILIRNKSGETEKFEEILQALHQAHALSAIPAAGSLIVATDKKIRIIPSDTRVS